MWEVHDAVCGVVCVRCDRYMLQSKMLCMTGT